MTERPVLFEPSVIRRLARDVADEALAFRFLDDYFELLPGRIHRIITAVLEDDPEAAMDAILSLKIASAMVGAKDTEDRFKILQSLIAGGNLESVGHELNALTNAVDTLVTQAPDILLSINAPYNC